MNAVNPWRLWPGAALAFALHVASGGAFEMRRATALALRLLF